MCCDGDPVCGGGSRLHSFGQTCTFLWKLSGGDWTDSGQNFIRKQQTHILSWQVWLTASLVSDVYLFLCHISAVFNLLNCFCFSAISFTTFAMRGLSICASLMMWVSVTWTVAYWHWSYTELSVSLQEFERSRAFGFLNEVKKRFQSTYGSRAQTALPYAMNSEFSNMLAAQMVRSHSFILYNTFTLFILYF